jgi:hypothetical protein
MIANNQPIVYVKLPIEAMNQPLTIVEFRDQKVDVSDLATVSSIVTDVSFVSCCSKEWIKIGWQLATLPQLKTLLLEHSDSKDSLCMSICGSKSLTSVRMGDLCATQKTVASPTKESNNYLRFNS